LRERNDMRGCLTLRLYDREDRLLCDRRHHNRIVTSGRQMVARMFGGVSSGSAPTRVTHMAVGTDATAPADADAALRAQRGGRKPIGEVTYEEFDEPVAGGGSVRRVRTRLTAEFDFGEANGNEPLREAGVFNAASDGVMYNRVTFEPVTKTDAFKLTLVWDIVF
jgi:hypothetical protein